MITDALVNFWPVGTFVPVTNVAVRSPIFDILGQGVGTGPANIIGTRTLFGSDVGIGGLRPQIEVLVGAAFLSGTSINVAFQAAADTATTYQPATWTTLVETGAIAAASLTAQQVLARFDFPPAFPANLNPRYLSLLVTPVGTFTAGTLGSVTTMVRDDQANKFAGKNYAVA